MTATTTDREATTATNATEAHAERARAEAEVSTLLSAAETSTVAPSDLNTARARVELATIAADRADADHRHATRVAKTAQSAQLLDTVAPALDAADAGLRDALEAFRTAADALRTAYRMRSQVVAGIVGSVTSTIDPSTTDRYRQGPEGVRIDGRLIRSQPEISNEVAGICAPLMAIGLPGIADQLATAGRVGNPLPRPKSLSVTTN